jgi:NAD(P)-dependent dehydrogenase (short-subunit alcohol dehydrogenase family)
MTLIVNAGRGRVHGLSAIVTGASRGIGRAICLVLAEAGVDIVLVARTQNEIDETANSVRSYGRRAVAIRCDVTKSEQVSHMVERTISEFGKIDILVNNAGIADRHMPISLCTEDLVQC